MELIVVLLLLALIWAYPMGLIWAMNTLFGMGIAYTFWNWLAAFVLLAVTKSPSVKKD